MAAKVGHVTRRNHIIFSDLLEENRNPLLKSHSQGRHFVFFLKAFFSKAEKLKEEKSWNFSTGKLNEMKESKSLHYVML